MSVRIALVRHGDAPFHIIDSKRQLSNKGKVEAHNTAIYLKEIKYHVKEIIHSDLERAKDTAEIIRQEIAPEITCQVSQDLRPESLTDIWEHNLMAWEKDRDLLIVSHMPFLPLLLEQLTGKRIPFPTAGCVVLEKEEDGVHWKLIQSNF